MRTPKGHRGLGLLSLAPLLAIALSSAPLPQTSAASGVQIMSDIVYGQDRGQQLTLDAYLPETDGSGRPAVIFVHGGGWFRGSKLLFQPEATLIAQQGWVAFSINYSLAPPRWPGELNDVLAAVHWVRQNADRFGVDPAEIGLVGSSAGGNLAALAGVRGSGSNDTGSRVRVVVSWSGPMDLTKVGSTLGCVGAVCASRERIPMILTQYLGCPPTSCPQTYHDASPVNYVDPSDPPMMIANSATELIPIEQARAMAQALHAEHVPDELIVVPGSRHATAYRTFIWPQTLEFLKRWITVARSSPTGATGGGTIHEPPSTSLPLIPIAAGVLVVIVAAIAVTAFLRSRR